MKYFPNFITFFCVFSFNNLLTVVSLSQFPKNVLISNEMLVNVSASPGVTQCFASHSSYLADPPSSLLPNSSIFSFHFCSGCSRSSAASFLSIL